MSGLTEFVNIYLEGGLEPGKLRMAATGLGWKGEQRDEKPTTIAAGDLKWMQWQRVGRGYQLRIGLKGEQRRAAFEGFSKEDHERLRNSASNYYNITLEEKETSVRGWNWGAAEVQGQDLAFLVAGKPAWTVPMSTIQNTTINKAEVGLEFRDEKMLSEIKKLEEEGSKEARRMRRGAPDELVEIRLFIPGTVGDSRRRSKAEKRKTTDGEQPVKKEEDDDAEMVDESDASLSGSELDGEDQAAAETFFETVKEKAEVGQVQGKAIVSFPEVLCTTPRGRFDVDMFSDFLRLRGKTYDYKILYESIVKLYLLPKTDEIHVQFVINLDPPIRQGQTRYPYLIMQFGKEEEMDAEIQLEEDVLKEKYDGKLEKRYEAPAYEVVSSVFKALSGKKVTTPGAFSSHGGHSAVKANLGANEGHLFLLDRSCLYISKNPLFIPYNDITEIRFERVSGALTSSARTFDLVIATRSGKNEHQFSAVSKDEQTVIEDFLKRDKKLRVKNVMDQDANVVNSAVVAALMEDDSSDSDAPRRAAGDEDEDSEVDEDFKAGSDDDDVAEEFNENYSGSSSGSSASGSDSDSGGDDDGDDDEEMAEASPPTKATKKTKALEDAPGAPKPKKQKTTSE